MKQPKVRISLDVELDLLQWLQEQVVATKWSRNALVNHIIRVRKEGGQDVKPV